MPDPNIQDIQARFDSLISSLKAHQNLDYVAGELVRIGVRQWRTLRPRHELFATPQGYLSLQSVKAALDHCDHKTAPQFLRVIGLWGGLPEVEEIASRYRQGNLPWRDSICALQIIGGTQAIFELAAIAKRANTAEEAESALGAIEDIASLESPEAASGGMPVESLLAEGIWESHSQHLKDTTVGALISRVERLSQSHPLDAVRLRAATTLYIVLSGAEEWLLRELFRAFPQDAQQAIIRYVERPIPFALEGEDWIEKFIQHRRNINDLI